MAKPAVLLTLAAREYAVRCAALAGVGIILAAGVGMRRKRKTKPEAGND